MQFDDLETARTIATLPPEPAAPRSERSAWGAVVRGPLAGVAEFGADIASLRMRPDSPEREAERDAQSFLPTIRPDSPTRVAERADPATVARDFSRSLRPDPATASTAEKVVFGATRGIAKAVAAVSTLGVPGGAAAFGGSEATATYDDLRRQGVDEDTALQVSGLTGVASAASVLLPASGSTIPRTLGLYLAGGPGGFVAQQAATRAILERADYHQLAQQYDPFDPIGLTLSALVPLPFAAAGAASALRKGGVPRETVDAAMVHNLTVTQDGLQARVDAALSDAPAYVRAGANGDPLAGDAMLTQRFVDEINGVPPSERQTTYQAPPARPAPELPGGAEAKPATSAPDQLDVVRQRVAAIEEQAPEAKAHMDEIRRQLAEGTDDELGTRDADLLRVAAECFLATA